MSQTPAWPGERALAALRRVGGGLSGRRDLGAEAGRARDAPAGVQAGHGHPAAPRGA